MVTAIQWGLRPCMAATVNAEDEDFMNRDGSGRGEQIHPTPEPGRLDGMLQ